jgi:hypothetical protein
VGAYPARKAERGAAPPATGKKTQQNCLGGGGSGQALFIPPHRTFLPGGKGSGGRPALQTGRPAAWCSLREGQAAHCPWKLSAVLPELAGAGTLFWHAR